MRLIDLAALSAVALCLTSPARAHDPDGPASRIAVAVDELVATFDDAQREAAIAPFDADARTGWNYFPDADIERFGLTLSAMTPGQRAMLDGLLLETLSLEGFRQAGAIRALEEVIAHTEPERSRRNAAGELRRDPLRYRLALFGTPGEHATWAWRFEGHHLSLNATIVRGRLRSVTPSFFGTNPAVVRERPERGGLPAGAEVLAGERAVAVDLVESLTDAQAEIGVIPADVPRDVLSRRDRFVRREPFEGGIGYADLDPGQRRTLLRLVDLFRAKYRPEVRLRVDAEGTPSDRGSLRFVWIGGTGRGEPHYYRVVHADFVLEYACVQNGSNHVHAVWRDFDGDFGDDALGRHLRAEAGR